MIKHKEVETLLYRLCWSAFSINLGRGSRGNVSLLATFPLLWKGMQETILWYAKSLPSTATHLFKQLISSLILYHCSKVEVKVWRSNRQINYKFNEEVVWGKHAVRNDNRFRKLWSCSGHVYKMENGDFNNVCSQNLMVTEEEENIDCDRLWWRQATGRDMTRPLGANFTRKALWVVYVWCSKKTWHHCFNCLILLSGDWSLKSWIGEVKSSGTSTPQTQLICRSQFASEIDVTWTTQNSTKIISPPTLFSMLKQRIAENQKIIQKHKSHYSHSPSKSKAVNFTETKVN